MAVVKKRRIIVPQDAVELVVFIVVLLALAVLTLGIAVALSQEARAECVPDSAAPILIADAPTPEEADRIDRVRIYYRRGFDSDRDGEFGECSGAWSYFGEGYCEDRFEDQDGDGRPERVGRVCPVLGRGFALARGPFFQEPLAPLVEYEFCALTEDAPDEAGNRARSECPLAFVDRNDSGVRETTEPAILCAPEYFDCNRRWNGRACLPVCGAGRHYSLALRACVGVFAE